MRIRARAPRRRMRRCARVFVIEPDKVITRAVVYPMTTGRNFDDALRVLDSLQLTAAHRMGTPG